MGASIRTTYSKTASQRDGNIGSTSMKMTFGTLHFGAGKRVAADLVLNDLLRYFGNTDTQKLVQRLAPDDVRRARRPRHDTNTFRPMLPARVRNGPNHDGRLAATCASKQRDVTTPSEKPPGVHLGGVQVKRHARVQQMEVGAAPQWLPVGVAERRGKL